MKKFFKAIGTMMLVGILGIGALFAYDLYQNYQEKYAPVEVEEQFIEEDIIEETIIEENKIYETTIRG